jgi:hypothetical protein
VFCAASVCAVRLAACVWAEGEQETAINWATIWQKEWLIVSGMCKGTWLLELKLFTCYFIPSYFCPQQTAHIHMSITALRTSPDMLF